MSDDLNIEYLSQGEIDRIKWDKCIDDADNGLIYAYSFYLDRMAKHWDALVLNDYDAVMPLTWNRKYSISYLYQPPFTASSGVFGKNLSDRLIIDFIEAIPQKFKLIEISLNHGNVLNASARYLIRRINYILPLNKNYVELYGGYRENHQRNIQRSLQAGNTVNASVAIDDIIRLNKAQMRNVSPTTENDYANLKNLYDLLFVQGKAAAYGIVSKQHQLLSSCVFFFSHHRAYYIIVGNHPASRDTGASHALIDAFIRDHAGEHLTLDFEGSDIESLALFYNGFGAQQEIYPAIRLNRLPWAIRWIKSKY